MSIHGSPPACMHGITADYCPKCHADETRRTAKMRADIAALRAENERLREALQFYADRDHLYGSMADDWESCSDQEASGWLFPPEPVDGESWGVESGNVARAALDAARAGNGS